MEFYGKAVEEAEKRIYQQNIVKNYFDVRVDKPFQVAEGQRWSR